MADYLYSPYEKTIWDTLMAFYNNPYAVAGMMGWMVGESGLYPYRCENDFTSGYKVSISITKKVNNYGNNPLGREGFGGYTVSGANGDNTAYRNIWYVNGTRYGPGYGLAQWTSTSPSNNRKGHLWDYWRQMYPDKSIANAQWQSTFIYYDMSLRYKTCLDKLLSATSIRQAMWDWGYYYEGGGSRTSSIVSNRINWGNKLYEKYTGSAPSPPYEGGDDGDGDFDPIHPQYKRMPLWMMIEY